MNLLKKESTYQWLMLLAFTAVIFLQHLPATYVSDDAVCSALTGTQTWLQRLQQLYHLNGRVLTDGFANLFYRMPMWVWKVFDTCAFTAAVCLLVRAFTPGGWKDVMAACALVGLFPFNYLNSAGWVATTANYLYTVLCLLVVVACVSRLERGEALRWWHWAVGVVCILYAANHDQTAAILIGGLAMYTLYCLLTRADGKKTRTAAILLGISVLIYAGMLLMPGHINRMNSTEEMYDWLPQYANWSFGKKLWVAFSTTAAPLVFGKVKLAALLYVLLAALALQRKKWLALVASAIPVGVVGICVLFGRERFICTYSYSCGMSELRPGWLPALISLAVLVSLVYVICACVEGKGRWLMLGALTLGAGSRLMMGLSPTVYASSFRTFTAFLFCIIVCCLVVLERLKKSPKSLLWYAGMAAAAVLFLVER